MKAVLCAVVYLGLMVALAVAMALPTRREGAAADAGDEDF
jgi:hypothetical protein